MSVKKEPSGRRAVQVEVEVQGTPEAVWKAIATGPGISAWFVPTKVDECPGGSIACDFGGGMVSSAKITEWEPPIRLVAEDSWIPGGPPIATQWTVEAKSGGTCIVRVVHSLFASTDDWDGQLESTENGWPSYFRVLRHYLQHHAGQPAASFTLMAPSSQGKSETWKTLALALGAAEPRVGQRLRTTSGKGAAFAGIVQAVDHLPEGHGVMLIIDEPSPGVVLASGMECMGMCMATFQAFFYGPGSQAAAGSQEDWQQWLQELFPAPPAEDASGN